MKRHGRAIATWANMVCLYIEIPLHLCCVVEFSCKQKLHLPNLWGLVNNKEGSSMVQNIKNMKLILLNNYKCQLLTFREKFWEIAQQ